MKFDAKFIFICASLLLEVALLLAGLTFKAKDLLGLLIVMPAGLHLVYGVVFNTKIYLPGYILLAGEREGLRSILLIGGVLQVAFCLYLATGGRW